MNNSFGLGEILESENYISIEIIYFKSIINFLTLLLIVIKVYIRFGRTYQIVTHFLRKILVLYDDNYDYNNDC